MEKGHPFYCNHLVSTGDKVWSTENLETSSAVLHMFRTMSLLIVLHIRPTEVQFTASTSSTDVAKHFT